MRSSETGNLFPNLPKSINLKFVRVTESVSETTEHLVRGIINDLVSKSVDQSEIKKEKKKNNTSAKCFDHISQVVHGSYLVKCPAPCLLMSIKCPVL